MKKRLLSIVAVVGLSALCSGCLLAAAGAVELDRQNHKAPPPPPSTATPDAGAAPAPPGAPQGNGTTSL